MFCAVDRLIPAKDREELVAALRKDDPTGPRLLFVEFSGADHGLIREARSAFNPQASAQGWRLLLGGDPVV